MKNSILIGLSILFCAVVANGQIRYTLNGCLSGYTYGNAGAFHSLSTNTSPFVADAGTNAYVSYFGSGPNTPPLKFVIYREYNFWRVSTKHLGSNAYNLITVQTSDDIDPPCNALWENIELGSICQLLFTGSTCVPVAEPSTTYFEALPSLVQIPKLATTFINQLQNLQNGMLVYDLTEKCLKLYRNGAWKCLGELGKTPTGTSNQRPANPEPGTIFFNTQTQKYEGYTASGWVDLH